MRKNKKTFNGIERRTVLALTSRGVKVWVTVILMIAGWMFALGVFVGRGTVPVKFDIDSMQKDLAAMRVALTPPKKENKPVQYKESDANPALEFHGTLKDAHPETAYKADLERVEEKPEPPLPPPAIAAVELPKPAETAPAQPAETEATAQKTDTPPAAGEPAWTIQVAAVKDVGDANRMVAALKKKGYDAYRVAADVSPGNTWHRVRVGAFAEREQAGGTMDRLAGDNFKGFIVKR